MKKILLETLPPTEQKSIRRMLEREFTAFFTAMISSSNRGWPEISGQVLADAIADSLMAVGKKRGMGVGVLQTLVHELQDRINLETSRDSK
jgi:hypothetical protein